MAGYFLTSDEYDNPNPSTGYNLLADAHYKKMVLKTPNEKRGQAKKACEELSDLQHRSCNCKASKLRKLYKQTHPSLKRLQSPLILFFTQESKKIRDAEGMQMCPVLAKQMSKKEKKLYVDEARRLKEAHDNVRKTRSTALKGLRNFYDLKNQIKIKKLLEFINWAQIEPTFNADGFPWTKILEPDGLRTLELD